MHSAQVETLLPWKIPWKIRVTRFSCTPAVSGAGPTGRVAQAPQPRSPARSLKINQKITLLCTGTGRAVGRAWEGRRRRETRDEPVRGCAAISVALAERYFMLYITRSSLVPGSELFWTDRQTRASEADGPDRRADRTAVASLESRPPCRLCAVVLGRGFRGFACACVLRVGRVPVFKSGLGTSCYVSTLFILAFRMWRCGRHSLHRTASYGGRALITPQGE